MQYYTHLTFSFPLLYLTLGHFSLFECNHFGLAAYLVPGFRLGGGIWATLIGSISFGNY